MKKLHSGFGGGGGGRGGEVTVKAGDEGGCSRLGVLASVAGVVGSLQGWAALRATTDVAPCPDGPTGGRMTVYSAAGTRWRQIDFPRDKDCPCCAQTPLREEARTVEQCHL